VGLIPQVMGASRFWHVVGADDQAASPGRTSVHCLKENSSLCWRPVENLAESSAYFAAGVAAHLNMVFRGFDHSRSVLGERAGQEPSRVVPCILVSPVDCPGETADSVGWMRSTCCLSRMEADLCWDTSRCVCQLMQQFREHNSHHGAVTRGQGPLCPLVRQ
jgi:hypothetical protein